MANGEQFTVNGFRRLQERLREEGWYVGWNLPCCQSCAWGELPYEFEDGTDIDFSKVLFNHSQDCEFDLYDHVAEYFDEHLDQADEFFEEYEDARDAVEDGHTNAVDKLFEKYNITHLLKELVDMDQSVSGFVCYTPEQQTESTFCFDGSKEGVKNLKAILPIIEECGCSIHWDGSGKTRPTISWEA